MLESLYQKQQAIEKQLTLKMSWLAKTLSLAVASRGKNRLLHGIMPQLSFLEIVCQYSRSKEHTKKDTRIITSRTTKFSSSVLLGFLLFSNFVASESTIPYYYSTEISYSDGLPKGLINGIIQDQYGFIWVTSQSGLFRYDGKTFKVYFPNKDLNKSIPDPVLYTGFVSSSGDFYVGSMSHGLMKYNRLSDTFSPFMDEPKNNNARSVLSILEDGNNNIWVDGTSRITKINSDGSGSIHHKFENESDKAEMLTYRKNQLFYAFSSKVFYGVCTLKEEVQQCLKELDVKFIKINPLSDNEIWVGTNDHGLYLYLINENKWILKEPNLKLVSALNIDRGMLLFTTTSNKLGLYDMQSKQAFDLEKHRSSPIISPDLAGNVQLRFLDKSGIAWASSQNKMIKIRSSNFIREIDLSIPNSTAISRIREDSIGNIWITYTGQGLLKYNTTTKSSTFHAPENHTSTFRRALQVLPDNSIIVGFSNSLVRYYPLTDTWLKLSSPLGVTRGINMTSDGSLIFDSQDLYRLDLNSRKIDNISQKYKIEIEKVLDIISLNNDQFLSLDYDQVHFLDFGSNQFNTFSGNNTNLNGISKGIKASAVFTTKNEIWINSVTQYLQKMSYPVTTNSTFESYPIVFDNLIIQIKALASDLKGDLWLGTGNGVVQFDTAKLTSRLFTLDDGISKLDFSNLAAFTSREGKIYFGTKNTLLEIIPDKVSKSNYMADIAITQVRINDEDRLVSDEHRLASGDDFIRLQFSSLDFNNPSRNKLRFKLLGHDKTWRQADNSNQAEYTKLHPGSYTFLVEGTNSHSVWSDKQAKLKFEVIASIWQTYPAYAIYVIFLVFFIAILFKIRMRSFQKVTDKTSMKVTERSEEISKFFLRKSALFTITVPNVKSSPSSQVHFGSATSSSVIDRRAKKHEKNKKMVQKMNLGTTINLSTEYDSLRDFRVQKPNIVNFVYDNYSCAIAFDGKQGLEIAQREYPDLVISDVMIPEVTCLELTKELRKNTDTQYIPIVIMTAQGSPDSKIKTYKTNPDDFITKPFRDDELLRRIESTFPIRELLEQNKFKNIEQEDVSFDKNEKSNNFVLSKYKSTMTDVENSSVFVKTLSTVIEENYANNQLTTKEISVFLNMTVRTLQRKINQLVGVSPLAYLRTYRLEKAMQLIISGHTSIKSIRRRVGMENNARFYEYFKQYTGKTPNEYVQYCSSRKLVSNKQNDQQVTEIES